MVVREVKDPALSLLWHRLVLWRRFNPWGEELPQPTEADKKKKKKKKKGVLAAKDCQYLEEEM